MADNYVTNLGSGGSTFASDEISAVQHPRVKVEWGADGVANDAAVAAPLPVQASHESNQMTAAGTVVTPKFAVISASASGDNSIVAANATKKLRVLGYVLVSSGTVNVTWRRGTTALTGAMPLIANTGIASAFSPVGWFETNTNEALNLNLSGATAVYGHVVYIEV